MINIKQNMVPHKLLARGKVGLQQVGGTLLDFILPTRCPNCSCKISAHGFLCPRCWADLKPMAAPYCAQCALPFEFDAAAGDICGGCLHLPPAFDWARAAVSYDDLGRSLVMRLKHGGATAVVPLMAQMMVGVLASGAAGSGASTVDLIMPVPLHRRRLLARRFNQSQLLAANLASRLAVPCDSFSLKKIRATESQGGLNRKARFANVTGSFAVETGRGAVIAGKHILLVDDVLTTGATASACALVLKKAGARSVGVAVFARVGKPVAG
jgi:ComF family protein